MSSIYTSKETTLKVTFVQPTEEFEKIATEENKLYVAPIIPETNSVNCDFDMTSEGLW